MFYTEYHALSMKVNSGLKSQTPIVDKFKKLTIKICTWPVAEFRAVIAYHSLPTSYASEKTRF
jgi:hypothetical protein